MASPQIRTVIQLNPAPDALGFAAASFARQARLITVRDIGAGFVATHVTMKAALGTRVCLNSAGEFSRDITATHNLLANAQPVTLLVAHQLFTPTTIDTLMHAARPDAVCVADPHWAPDALPPVPTGTNLRAFGNEAGAHALTAAFAALHAARARRLATPTRTYTHEDLIACDGLHPIERGDAGLWAWTGPGTIATLLAPMHGPRARLTLSFLATNLPLDQDHVKLMINGQLCQTSYDEAALTLETEADNLAAHARIDILQAALPVAPDGRRLGLALHKLRIEARP